MKKTILFTFLFITAAFLNAQVAINTDGSNANSSAMLDIKSDTAGILIPRMTSAQRDAINNPAQGLMVFVTNDSTFYYYDNSTWKPVGRGASGWNVSEPVVYMDSVRKVVIGTDTTTGVFEVVTKQATGNYSADRCTGGAASAQEHQSSYVAANAFDDDLLSLWRNNGSIPVWIAYDFGAGNSKTIARYQIYWQGADGGLTPKDWRFQASNDGATWTTLDTQTGQSWSSGEWKTFTIANTETYRHYRIYITANNGGANNGVYIQEIEMLEMIYGNHSTLFVADNKVGIGTESPAATLEVNGSFKYVDGNEAAGKVLTADASGNAGWTDGSSITNTLDAAYDQGGAGMGKNITADAGMVSINGTDGFLVTGTHGLGINIDSEVTGTGTRMFFYPRKAAFRAGNVSLDAWDDANIGDHSIAMGNNPKASGNFSVAIGDIAMATGLGSFSIGHSSVASGDNSFAIGSLVEAPSGDEIALGSYNTLYTPVSTTGWNNNDRLFSIGNGATYNARSNALTIYKDGRMNINDEYFMPQTDGTANQVMQTDGAGQVSFVDPASISGWTISGDTVFNLSDHIGVGTSSPGAKMNIHNTSADTALSVVNGKVGIGAQYGVFTTMSGSTSSYLKYQYGVYNKMSGSGSNNQYGTYNYMEGGSGPLTGSYSFINASSSNNSTLIGTENHFSNADGSGDKIGTLNYLKNINGDLYGCKNILLSSSTNTNGTFYGNYTLISTTSGSGGNGNKYASYDTIPTSLNGTHYGVYSVAEGASNYAGYFKGNLYVQDKLGIGTSTPETKVTINNHNGEDTTLFINDYVTSDNLHVSVQNNITGTGSGNQAGFNTENYNTGGGYHYGYYATLSGSGSGQQRAYYANIDNSGNSYHFGFYSRLEGSGTGEKHGFYTYIPESTGGTHYGIYCNVSGTSNYAGYFKGNVHVTDRLTAPASGTDADLKPYIYGSLKDTDGSYYTAESTGGFTSTKESTGVYKITFNNYNSDKSYLVIANALRVSSAIILTYEKDFGFFRIRAWDISGNLVDTYLNFVVYKK